MKILFSAFPMAGRMLPLLPLADAAVAAGAETAFLSGANLAGHLDSRTLLPIGPGLDEPRAERRNDGDAGHPDEALDRAGRFAPDLIVCDAMDFVGPMVAARLDVPWVQVAITPPVPETLAAAMHARAKAQRTSLGLRPRPRLAVVDPMPDVLRSPADRAVPDDRIAMRPTAHADGATPELPASRPLVLVTIGTSVDEPELLPGLTASIADAGHEVVVTVEPGTLPENPRVHELGFAPLAQLLPHVDAVVGAGDTGTTLATLAAGLPMVLRPVLADQPWNAERVSAVEAAIVIESPAEAGAAVRAVLSQARYRAAARSIAAGIRSMPAPAAVLAELLVRAGLSAEVG